MKFLEMNSTPSAVTGDTRTLLVCASFGANSSDIVGGEVVLGGAIEDGLQIVRRGAESLFYLRGDVSLRGDFATIGGCYLHLDAAVMDRRAFITIKIAVCGFGNLIENAANAFPGAA